ncbi:MAG: hypothetical protein RI940_56 [Bacteroidota bacterium]|jgi:uncharacterized RDD family membrane protein YckC
MNPTKQTIGEGTRIMNFFLDTIFICFLSYFIYRWYNFYAFYGYFKPVRYGYFFFAITWAYTFLFELLFCRTIAKMISKTKVISTNGKRPNIFQFLIRATLRTSLVTMVGLAWNDQPLHDTFSKTVLVSTRK